MSATTRARRLRGAVACLAVAVAAAGPAAGTAAAGTIPGATHGTTHSGAPATTAAASSADGAPTTAGPSGAAATGAATSASATSTAAATGTAAARAATSGTAADPAATAVSGAGADPAATAAAASGIGDDPAATAAVVSGIGDDPAAPAAGVPGTGADRAAVPAGRVLTGPTAGCGARPSQEPGTSADRTLTSGGIERSVRVHLPDGYTADRAWPVVLVFHGRGNSGPTTEGFSGLSELPAIVAYPDGVPGGEGKRSWQGAPYSAPGVDDVAFTGDLLDHLEDTLCVDTHRVQATGKSNGGGFTEILACRMPARIAAIAPVAGAYYRAGEPPCAPGRPVPALFVHGTADATIPYTGDADRGLPAIPDKVAEWADRDGCRAEPATRRIEPDVTVQRFEGCARGGQVGHVAVDGGGHTWPGATAYSGGGHTTQTVRASELIGAFFGLVRS